MIKHWAANRIPCRRSLITGCLKLQTVSKGWSCNRLRLPGILILQTKQNIVTSITANCCSPIPRLYTLKVSIHNFCKLGPSLFSVLSILQYQSNHVLSIVPRPTCTFCGSWTIHTNVDWKCFHNLYVTEFQVSIQTRLIVTRLQYIIIQLHKMI